MALSEHLSPSGHKKDKVLAIYDQLDTDDRTTLATALTATSRRGGYAYTSGDVARALQAEGCQVNAGQVRALRSKLKDGSASL